MYDQKKIKYVKYKYVYIYIFNIINVGVQYLIKNYDES